MYAIRNGKRARLGRGKRIKVSSTRLFLTDYEEREKVL